MILSAGSRDKVFSPIFTKPDLTLLKSLGGDNSIVVCRPDKGRGVVLMDKTDYNNKMDAILSDHTKFKKMDIDMFKLSLQQEDKINRFVNQLFKDEIISKTQKDLLYCTGTGPGIMYGLPKVHKEATPLRPILAAYNTSSFQLAKFLVPLLEPLTTNDYTLSNSYEFFRSISSLNLPRNSFLSSYDVTSLFTNIPLEETIDIICDRIFSSNEIFHGMVRRVFRTFLTLACKQFFFIFNGTPYTQVDGVCMGSPLGSSLANIFLCHHETSWLDNCPQHFKPTFYRRFVDDTFVVFDHPSHADLFLDYLNRQHPNIQFTRESEEGSSLAFLDLKIARTDTNLTTSIYRKPTFSGLGLSFFSYVPTKFKINAIRTLLHRAYHLTSSYLALSDELDFLRNFFLANGYPKQLFDTCTGKFLSAMYHRTQPLITAPKDRVYLSMPYYGSLSTKIEAQLIRALSKFYPQVDFKPVMSNNFSIGSFFHFKDRIPSRMLSGIIYKYTCESCHASYIGSSERKSKVRFDQHLGISSRTGRHLSTLTYSAPREHSEQCGRDLRSSDFSIVSSGCQPRDLLILESLHIHRDRPTLNLNRTAVPLHIVS